MDPHIAVHGSFSVMVNYHAIGLYFISRNGFVLHNPQEEASLKVSAFVLTGASDDLDGDVKASQAWAQIAPQIAPPTQRRTKHTVSGADVEDDDDDAATRDDDATVATTFADDGASAAAAGQRQQQSSTSSSKPPPHQTAQGWTGDAMERISAERSLVFPHLCRVFEDEIVRFGPNDFFVLQKSMKEDSQQPTLKGIVALLKLGDWDPDVFYKFRDVILNQAPVCGCKLRNDLCRDLPRVWDNHYSLDKDKDVSFEVGRFYYGIREHEKALQFYRTSTEHIGEHHVTFHNMGLCYYSLGQLDVALDHFEKSLVLNDVYEKARSWHQKVSREIERQQSLLQSSTAASGGNVPPPVSSSGEQQQHTLASTQQSAAGATNDAVEQFSTPPLPDGSEARLDLSSDGTDLAAS